MDQYLNIKLTDVQVVEKCSVTPHLISLSAPFDSFTLLHESPPRKGRRCRKVSTIGRHEELLYSRIGTLRLVEV